MENDICVTEEEISNAVDEYYFQQTLMLENGVYSNQ